MRWLRVHAAARQNSNRSRQQKWFSTLQGDSPSNTSRNNAIIGLSLAAFVCGVFYYTVSRIKTVGNLGPDFDEKLQKPCEDCDQPKKKS